MRPVVGCLEAHLLLLVVLVDAGVDFEERGQDEGGRHVLVDATDYVYLFGVPRRKPLHNQRCYACYSYWEDEYHEEGADEGVRLIYIEDIAEEYDWHDRQGSDDRADD